MNPRANLQGDRVAARASSPQRAPPRHFLRERDLFASVRPRESGDPDHKQGQAVLDARVKPAHDVLGQAPYN
jgi:hypothetical protein